MNDSSTTLYLVRHGETQWNLEHRFQGQKDSPLSPRGIKQINTLGPYFEKNHIDALYSSDLGRAMTTANIISQVTGLQVEALKALRERCFGIFEGLTHEPARKIKPQLFHQWRSGSMDVKVPGGESRQEMLDRVLPALYQIIDQHPGQKVAIVSHGGTLSALWRFLEPSRPESDGFSIPNASISTLSGQHKKLLVLKWSEINHLKGLKSLDDPSI